MRLVENSEAVPWEFTPEEVTRIKGLIQDPLMQCYLQSLKHAALNNSLADPTSSSKEDVIVSNAYIAGQDYLLSALTSKDLYVRTYKENK